MFDENSNGGKVKLTLKDKRRPTPLDVRLATQRARGENTNLNPIGNGALSTPDIVNVTVRFFLTYSNFFGPRSSVPKGFFFGRGPWRL